VIEAQEAAELLATSDGSGRSAVEVSGVDQAVFKALVVPLAVVVVGEGLEGPAKRRFTVCLRQACVS
jgi:hypothetical protein